MDVIVQCLLIYTLSEFVVSMAKKGFTVARLVIHMLANIENQLDARPEGCLYSGGLSLFCWAVYFGGLSLF